MLKNGKGRAVALIESFTHRFSSISAMFMIFMDFEAWVPKNGKGRAVAPIESFTRFQLAAIIDCYDFPRFSLILTDFYDFHGFRSMGV